jgi:hypothetical protein
MPSPLILLLLLPSFALIMLVALATGFFFFDPPRSMASMLLIFPYYGSVVASVMMLSAGWLCAAGGGMKWTRLNWPVLFVAWFLLMMVMTKVGLHVFLLWFEGSVGVSRVALLMGGIVAPITCQVLLLTSAFIKRAYLQLGERSYMRVVISLAVAMVVSLAIGATTLLIKTSSAP